jgi:hypothetical protein
VGRISEQSFVVAVSLGEGDLASEKNLKPMYKDDNIHYGIFDSIYGIYISAPYLNQPPLQSGQSKIPCCIV